MSGSLFPRAACVGGSEGTDQLAEFVNIRVRAYRGAVVSVLDNTLFGVTSNE